MKTPFQVYRKAMCRRGSLSRSTTYRHHSTLRPDYLLLENDVYCSKFSLLRLSASMIKSGSFKQAKRIHISNNITTLHLGLPSITQRNTRQSITAFDKIANSALSRCHHSQSSKARRMATRNKVPPQSLISLKPTMCW